MTETPRDKSDLPADVPPTGRAAGSPYDEPTEKIPVAGRNFPQTDDDLDIDPTQQLPTYRPDFDDEPSRKQYAFEDSSPSIPMQKQYAFEPDSSAAPAAAVATKTRRRNRQVDEDELRGRGTLDLGLLLLRVGVGALFVFHGLQKLTGWWGGPGLDGMRDALDAMGWEQPRLCAILLTVGELAGGSLLILGLATPLAAGAVLAVIIDAWLARQSAEHGLQFTAPNGPEYETLLMIGAAAIILTGPGKYAVDGGRGWATRPYVGSLLALFAAIAAAACTWIFLRGGNPFV
ncbi:DoxX family protein [Antrihabitans spumae]|uniref:DoxX family protein n=1 Tax=Antrihabitans spumae TaxID=3373370 RepID=A0ABW7KDX4_9NOCA